MTQHYLTDRRKVKKIILAKKNYKPPVLAVVIIEHEYHLAASSVTLTPGGPNTPHVPAVEAWVDQNAIDDIYF